MSKTFTTKWLITPINGITANHSLVSHSSNYETMSSRTVQYIVMHYTGNSSDLAKSNANYFVTGNRQASAHFFVDDTSIYQSVGIRDKAWHCGTSGTYYHSTCRNTNSIGIEMCTSGNYKISDKTKENAAQLAAFFCKKLGVTAATVDTYLLRHYDVTHKSCPAQMAGSSNAEWTAFKARVKELLGGGTTTTTTTKTATESATSYLKSAAGTYTTTCALPIRNGAGTTKTQLVKTAKGDSVQCFGYYTAVGTAKWYYVQYKSGSTTYTGFCNAKYLK